MAVRLLLFISSSENNTREICHRTHPLVGKHVLTQAETQRDLPGCAAHPRSEELEIQSKSRCQLHQMLRNAHPYPPHVLPGVGPIPSEQEGRPMTGCLQENHDALERKHLFICWFVTIMRGNQ